jgi:hypothetical protein
MYFIPSTTKKDVTKSLQHIIYVITEYIHKKLNHSIGDWRKVFGKITTHTEIS